jgi:hypothetical protein
MKWNSLFGLVLGWTLVLAGAVGTLLALLGVYYWYSPDNEATQAEATGLTMGLALFPFLGLLLPGVWLLRIMMRHREI